jgi:hypothetical protein
MSQVCLALWIVTTASGQKPTANRLYSVLRAVINDQSIKTINLNRKSVVGGHGGKATTAKPNICFLTGKVVHRAKYKSD